MSIYHSNYKSNIEVAEDTWKKLKPLVFCFDEKLKKPILLLLK